jgi:hypothetical protein
VDFRSYTEVDDPKIAESGSGPDPFLILML